MDERYISVADFAARQGLSRQAVYQSISKGTLKQFVKIIDKRKYIDIQAFSAVDCKADCKEPVNHIDNKIDNTLQAVIEAKTAHINTLEQQLKEARRQIEFLEQQIERQAVIIEKQLHLQAHTQQLLEEPNEAEQPIVENPPAAAAAAPHKRNLFSRIFKK